jgi:hypothetical protein
MRQTTYLCNRCGNSILENRAIVEIKSGALGSRHNEPIDLCGDCQARFDDWLRGGRQTAGFEPGTAPAVSVGGLNLQTK